MKPKALILSAAVLLGSATLAFAQTQTTTPPEPGTAVPQHMNGTASGSSKSMTNGLGSGAQQSNNAQPGSTGTKQQAQSQPPRTSKHRTLASKRLEPSAVEGDRATTALNLLEEHGYRDFSTFQRAGKDYEIKTQKNGNTVTVLVNPATKTVQTQG